MKSHPTSKHQDSHKELINDESRFVDLAVDRSLAGKKVVGWFQGRFEWGP
jgi:predicted NodU family carbamoyl transferase